MINYAYWLSNIPGIGIRTRNRLIGAAGSAREVYGLTEKTASSDTRGGRKACCRDYGE